MRVHQIIATLVLALVLPASAEAASARKVTFRQTGKTYCYISGVALDAKQTLGHDRHCSRTIELKEDEKAAPAPDRPKELRVLFSSQKQHLCFEEPKVKYSLDLFECKKIDILWVRGHKGAH